MREINVLGKVELLKLIGCALLISWSVGYLFYDVIWGCILAPIAFHFLKKYDVTRRQESERRQLEQEFVETLKILESSLVAGSSLEIAFIDAQRDIYEVYGNKSVIYVHLKGLNQSVAMNKPIEEAFGEFAHLCGVEEIETFSEILNYCKRNGGSLVEIIHATSTRIQQIWETQAEIEVLITSKKYELTIMSILPLLIMLYLKISFRDYLSILYGNVIGVAIMSGCLAVYGVALYLGRRLLQIRI